MPTPLEICLEDLALSEQDERYIRCVALPGGEPGLSLDRDGAVRWMPAEPAQYGLWISADDQLVLVRGDGAGPLTVSRAGRSLEAPEAKPVVLLDQDLLVVNGRRLRVHVHGVAAEVHPPERLSGSALARMARTAAAALALGAAVVAPGPMGIADAAPPIEVRTRPPAPMPTRAPVTCAVTAMTPTQQGPVLVHATCPATPTLITVGVRGQLYDAAGGAIANGSVIVKSVQGTQVVSESQLRKPVKATKVIFYLPR
jgi:hypothetical protein